VAKTKCVFATATAAYMKPLPLHLLPIEVPGRSQRGFFSPLGRSLLL